MNQFLCTFAFVLAVANAYSVAPGGYGAGGHGSSGHRIGGWAYQLLPPVSLNIIPGSSYASGYRAAPPAPAPYAAPVPAPAPYAAPVPAPAPYAAHVPAPIAYVAPAPAPVAYAAPAPAHAPYAAPAPAPAPYAAPAPAAYGSGARGADAELLRLAHLALALPSPSAQVGHGARGGYGARPARAGYGAGAAPAAQVAKSASAAAAASYIKGHPALGVRHAHGYGHHIAPAPSYGIPAY